MKKYLSLFIFLLCATVAHAQAGFIQVTGTVVDPQSFPYSNGTVEAQIVPNGVNTTINGKPFSGHLGPATLDLNGVFNMTLADNTLVSASGTQWDFHVCAFLSTVQWPVGRGSQCFDVTLTIHGNGTTQDISTQLQAAATSLTNVCPNINLSSAGCGNTPASGCTVGGFADQSVLFIHPLATCAVDTNLLWDPTSGKQWLLVGGPAPIRPGSFDNFDTILTPEPDWNDTQGTFARIVTLGGHTINSCTICVAAETKGDSTGVGGNVSGMEIVSWDNAKEVSNGGPYGIYLQTGSNNATGSTSSTTIGVFNKLYISGAGTTDNLVPFWAHTEGLTGTAARHANGMGFYAEGLVDVSGANHIFDTYADFLGDLAGHSGGEVTAHCGLVIGTVCGAPGSGANGGTWSLLVGPLGVAGDSFRAKINADLFVNGKITLGQDGTSAEGFFDVTEIAAPANPSAGFERWYANNSTHTFTCLTSSGGSCNPSASVTLNQVLDPTADKTFAMGNHLLEFDNLSSFTLKPNSSATSLLNLFTVPMHSADQTGRDTLVFNCVGAAIGDGCNGNGPSGPFSFGFTGMDGDNIWVFGGNGIGAIAFLTTPGVEFFSQVQFNDNNSLGGNTVSITPSVVKTSGNHLLVNNNGPTQVDIPAVTGWLEGIRFDTHNATALVSGDFALGAGWGSTAAISAVTGTDQAFNLTITTGGSGIAANPTTTLTFHDGTWTNSPIFTCSQTGGNDVLADITFTSGVATATTLPMIWNGTPTTAKTYIFSCVGMGR